MDGKPTDPQPETEGWRSRLASDLAARDARHREVWGDTDELLRARYTAGKCSDEEKARVEQAMRDYPAVRESIETVQKLMGNDEPPSQPDALDHAGEQRPHPKPRTDLTGRAGAKPETSR
jgi:hypothetical protein